MAQIFAAFGKFSQNNKGSVQNFGIVGVTIATEELTKFIFFFCPCDQKFSQIYGSTFIWGPAAILLVVGYVVNRRTWRLTTGLCNRTQSVGTGCKRVIHFLFIFMNISMKAVLAPATWIVISFLKGDYYACAAWPAPDDSTVYKMFGLTVNSTIPPPCSFSLKPPLVITADKPAELIARDLRAYSHIIGWWFLSYALMIGIVMICIFRCMSKYSYEQSKYIEKYRAKEMELFEAALDTKAETQAKIIVDQFFTKPRKKEEWDQIASINDKVMKSKRGRPIYSPLHKFSNKELAAAEIAQMEMVADSAVKKFHINVKRKKKPANTSNPTVAAPAPGPNTGGGGFSMVALGVAGAQRPRVTNVPHHPPPVTAAQAPVDKSEKPDAGDPPKINESVTAEEEKVNEVQQGSSEELDPIEEANTGIDPSIRRSLIASGNEDQDPILEATLMEHPEVKRSMERLSVHDDALEINEETDFNDVDEQFKDGSQPLLA